jgi:hypothetical protein
LRKDDLLIGGLIDDHIHRLVRVTAYYVLVYEDRSLDGSTQQPRPIIVVMDLGFKSDPNMHWALSGPLRVRIEARQRGWRQYNLASDGLQKRTN